MLLLSFRCGMTIADLPGEEVSTSSSAKMQDAESTCYI